MVNTAIGVVGLCGVYALALGFGTGKMERDLTHKTRSLLAEAGIDGARVRFHGRDGVIVARAPLPSEVVARIASSHDPDFDVHRIDVVIDASVQPAPSVASPSSGGFPTTTARSGPLAPIASTTSAAAPTTVPSTTTEAPPDTAAATSSTTEAPATSAPAAVAASVSATVDGGGLVLAGTVGSAADHDAVLAAARAFGSQVTDRVAVASVISGSSTFLPSAAAVIAALGADTPFTLVASGTSFAVSGGATTFGGALRVLQAIGSARAAGTAITAQLTAPSLVLTDVQFPADRATLDTDARVALDVVATVLRANPVPPIEVGGHTDNRGTAWLNGQVSQQRADAVRAYLASRGVAADRLTAVGYGSSRPIADNGTAAGLVANRRVELVLTEARPA